MSNLEEDFNYYLEHREELLDKYYGRYIVIKNSQVIGDFDSEQEAFETASNNHEVGTFLIQHCVPGEASTNATFYSRVRLI